MISFYTVATIGFLHWLFDFFFQSEEVANNKSKSNLALIEHVCIYWFGLTIMALVNYKCFSMVGFGFAWVFINVIAHFFTDWVTSRATSLLYKEERYRDFFNVIGIDQFTHHIVLYGTFIWLSNF